MLSDRQLERAGDCLVAGGGVREQHRQQRPLTAGQPLDGRRERGAELAERGAALGGDQALLIHRRDRPIEDVLAFGRELALALTEDPQALAPAGGFKPCADGSGLAHRFDVLEQSKPRRLCDVLDVVGAEPVRSGDSAYARGESLDQRRPRASVACCRRQHDAFQLPGVRWRSPVSSDRSPVGLDGVDVAAVVSASVSSCCNRAVTWGNRAVTERNKRMRSTRGLDARSRGIRDRRRLGGSAAGWRCW